MKDKLDNIRVLVNQRKFKKALQLLKKYTPPNKPCHYECLILEAQCLTYEANDQLGYLKFQQALKLTDNILEQKHCLDNMAASAERLGKQAEALYCLKHSLQLDGSAKSAHQRFSLLKLAQALNDPATVEQYAPPLLGLSQYHLAVTLLLAETASQSGQQQQALDCLQQLITDIITGDRLKTTPEEVQRVLNACHQLLPEKKARSLSHALESSDTKHLAPVLSQTKVRTGFTPSPKHSNNSPVSISGNNPAAQRVLSELVAELQSLGAEFTPHLMLLVEDGNLSVRLNTASESSGQCVGIPFSAMPIVSDYHFSLAQNFTLQTQPKHKMLNPSAARVMQLMTTLYNACNKLSDWRNSYPLFALAGCKALFSKLISARSDHEKFRPYYVEVGEELNNETLLESFFASRVLGVAAEQVSTWTGNSCDTEQLVFIPLAELTNHQMGAPRFQFDSKKRHFSSYYNAGKAGREIFAQYNFNDPMLSVLMYGFADTSASWLYSIPLHFTSPSGLTFDIANELQMADRDKLPANIADLAEFIPGVVKRTDDHIYISKLVIPAISNFDSLKRCISASLLAVDIDGRFKNPEMLSAEVGQIEQQVINANQQYWRELSILVSEHTQTISAQALEILDRLCHFSTAQIQAYQKNRVSNAILNE
ncbi:hypothetical protein [Bowmanella pacifica]|uniref:Uncharacterized protein n=2 Tax=Bowmanella TaxID=366580 RepID=A0A918DMP5_9ALTE|nr:hypothetical protein [Bowmanella pacifica]GGO72614.1 hypothetical protein GCM10010982_31160 [Bowmanella pacifica]